MYNLCLSIKIALIIFGTASYEIGYESCKNDVRNKLSNLFDSDSDDTSTESDSSPGPITMKNVKLVENSYGDYFSADVTADAKSTRDISNVAIKGDVYNKNNKVLGSIYINQPDSMTKDTDYTASGNINTKDYNYDDIDHIEFYTGSGRNKKIITTWKK